MDPEGGKLFSPSPVDEPSPTPLAATRLKLAVVSSLFAGTIVSGAQTGNEAAHPSGHLLRRTLAGHR